MLTPRKLVPVGRRTCNYREIATTGKAVLFDRVVQLGTSGTATDTSEEKINVRLSGHCPKEGEIDKHIKASVTHTVQKLTVRKQWAMESLTKQMSP